MTERDRIQSTVERIVAEVLQSHTVQLRDEIVRRVTDETVNLPVAQAVSGVNSADLARAVSEIRAGTSQREILRALLDACTTYAARVALFVVKSGSVTGWQGRGFSNNDSLKDFGLDVSAPAVSRAVHDQNVVSAHAGEIDPRFVEQFGSPASGEASLLPLLLKDKVAALLYADGGVESAPRLDPGSLELLVFSTSAWLEINSLRKQVQKPPGEGDHPHSGAAPVAAAASYSDPFAAHQPSHAMAAAAAAEAHAPAFAAAMQSEPAVAEPEPSLQAEAVVSEPGPAAAPSVSSEDEQVLRKAQRFARLLIDEIKLYNQAKVAEGRKNRDLYDRLKEAIEKSRATYQKRYGNTVAAASDYFQYELVRSLAEDDISIMGANFPR
jgi:hypothetical protein